MDVSRIDTFARTLASGTTRRAFIRSLTWSGAGAIAGIGVARAISAAEHPTGTGSDVADHPACDPITCPSGSVFSETECACVCHLVCRPNVRR